MATARRRRSRLSGALAWLFAIVLGLTFIGTLVFLYDKSKDEGPSYETDKPIVADIVKKAVATGSIVPRREIMIKPRVSGIVRKLEVAPGDVVKEGDLIAEIKIVPDVAALSRAEASVRSARIALRHAELELERTKGLGDRGLASKRELAQMKLLRAAPRRARRRPRGAHRGPRGGEPTG